MNTLMLVVTVLLALYILKGIHVVYTNWSGWETLGDKIWLTILGGFLWPMYLFLDSLPFEGEDDGPT